MTPDIRRLEAASMNAWPGLGQTDLDGWIVRHGEGHTKRCNSISALTPAPDPGDRIAAGEAILAAAGQPPIARIVDTAGEATVRAFVDAGYGEAFDTTATIWRPLDDAPALPAGVELIIGAPTPEWLEAKDALNGESTADNEARRKILPKIALPIAYGGLRGENGAYASLAYMALDGDIASLNMVVTDPAQRGRRYSQKVCQGLLAWAHGAGARQACLQVVAENMPARRLYARLGYGEPLYFYHYRRKDM